MVLHLDPQAEGSPIVRSGEVGRIFTPAKLGYRSKHLGKLSWFLGMSVDHELADGECVCVV